MLRWYCRSSESIRPLPWPVGQDWNRSGGPPKQTVHHSDAWISALGPAQPGAPTEGNPSTIPQQGFGHPLCLKYRSGGTIAPTKIELTHSAGPSAYSRKQHLPPHQHSTSTHWWCVSEWSWLSYRAPAWPCPYQSRSHGTTIRRRQEITQ